MIDDDRDRSMMRNQLVAIVLMTVLVMAWFHFYGPKPKPAQQQTTSQSSQPVNSEGQVPPLSEPSSSPDAWPFLPPVPDQVDPASDEVKIENQYLRLVFTKIGGRLKQACVLLDEKGTDTVELVPRPLEGFAETETIYPLGIHFSDEKLGDEINRYRFDAETSTDGKAVTFTFVLPNAARIKKTFRLLNDQPYCLDADISYENLETTPRVLGMDQTPAYIFNWGPSLSSGDEKAGTGQKLYWLSKDTLDSIDIRGKRGGLSQFSKSSLDAYWLAIKSAYFVVALKPSTETAPVFADSNGRELSIGVAAPRFEAMPSQPQTSSYSLYIGPSQLVHLKAAWPGLEKVQRFFSQRWDIMDRFAKLLLAIMNWFYQHVWANYGVSIIFLTVLVRMVMYPLTLKSMRSMKKMQLLAPEMEELKAKYGKEPQELQKKMMELYRERGVNPMGGCFPMLLQMPVFIALYRMLWTAYELRGAPFMFWMQDLSEADRLMHFPALAGLPLVGTFEYLNVLPILMGAAMLLNQKMMPVSGPAQGQQQKILMYFMPVFFSFICYSMASGLNLYILTSTVLGMVQQKFTKVSGDNTVTKKTPRKRQHFYTAAMARKRRLVKEAKKERKSSKTASSEGGKR